MANIRYGVLTVSDSCSEGKNEDRSGPEVNSLLQKIFGARGGSPTVYTAIVPDEVTRIQKTIIEWCSAGVDLIVTTGGTGFSSRDVTPESVSPLLDRRADAMAAVMVNQGMANTPLALLSRPVCGIRGRTLIITLPGSVKAVRECLEILRPALPHAVNLLREEKIEVQTVHCNCGGPNEELGVEETADSIVGRPRHSPYPMIDKNEALKIVETTIRDKIFPALEEELLSPYEALGRTCTKDVLAAYPFPPFRASIKDGYAVRCGGSLTPRVHEYAATAGAEEAGATTGGNAQLVDKYSCVRISTGGVVPDGADAVVQVEDTMLVDRNDFDDKELRIELKKLPVPGQDIRPIGCDIAQGHLLLAKGDRVDAAAIGTLVMAGVKTISVSRLPTVGVLSTGNELNVMTAEKGENSTSVGRIPDSNRPMLLALLKQIGVPTVDLGVAEDTKDALKNTLLDAAPACDIIITSGGVSMGEKDLMKPVLKSLGYKIHFGRVNIKPGKPTTFATEPEGRIVFALPGNPASAFVMFHIFVRAALRVLGADVPIRTAKARLCIGKPLGLDPRPEFLRGKASVDPITQTLKVQPTPMQQSSSLLSCLDADVLIGIPGGREKRKVVNDGEVVDIIWI